MTSLPANGVFNELIKIQKKNKLAIKDYTDLIKHCKGSFFTTSFENLKKEKLLLDKELTEKMVVFEEEYFYSQTLENATITPFFDFHIIGFDCEEDVLEEVLQGEEKTMTQLKNVLAEDLSDFGEVRDVLIHHTFKVQVVISNLKEFS